MTRYAELQAATNFSFLRGASHPHEIVAGADALGMEAVGICDRNTLAGVVRAWSAMEKLRAGGSRIRALTGCRLDFADGTPSLLVYPSDREAYGRLTRLLTLGQRRAEKGECHLHWPDFRDAAEGQLVLVVPPERLDEGFEADLRRIAGELPDVCGRPPGRPAPAPSRVWPGGRRGATRTARRSSPPTTCSTTDPSGDRCRTC